MEKWPLGDLFLAVWELDLHGRWKEKLGADFQMFRLFNNIPEDLMTT